ncbi:AAA family ATPase [Micromonospora tulbaghiae]|uniref:NACHT domain-containing protein n=1 Tax=Micromonospora tulbaghiae TaxID=479978 RepID=UPI0034488B3F
MSDTLSYADAVRLLGGEKSKVVDWFDKLTGGVLLAASVPVPALLGIFDAKAEFVRLGHELVRGVSEKRSGLSRYGRTQRLEAAHAVIAVTAFFEAFGESALPSELADVRLSGAEELSLAGAGAVTGDVVSALFGTAAPLPGPQLPYAAYSASLVEFYQKLVVATLSFLKGLSAGEALSDRQWHLTESMLARVPQSAVNRHRDLLSQLAADFPEVSFWAALHEHEATRGEIRRLSVGLDEMRHALAGFSTGRAPDDRRSSLNAAYTAALRRPIITSGDVPAGLTVPSLGEGYIPPLCRIAELDNSARPSDETWWEDKPVRDDLWQSLVVHLTSPGAPRSPLLILGQPGSGKSVLTRIVAAQLPAADFLVVRVVLRDVFTAGEIQDQIEQAIRKDTGERLDWPALARSAGDALPVVLLDGFDELLQATGVSQTDYLIKVAAFQRREADQGRPVAVLVTSRTSVADRAQSPPDTVAVRLEPFDGVRVRTWVRIWNRANAVLFGSEGRRDLDPATVLSHRELAEQPLLLLMLALYDAEGSELRRAGELSRGELYERLLRRFARREVAKQRDGASARDLALAVEEELCRLAVVAFAMFNRRVQWATEIELDQDLAVLPFGGTTREDVGLRTPLLAAERLLGRFFFIHRARTSGDERRRETYEFLHATFGEYLVARLIGQIVDDLVAKQAAASLSWDGDRIDDDLLNALLSYAVLSTRATVLAFLAERLDGSSEDQRRAWADLALRLLRVAPHRGGPRRFDGYRPRPVPIPSRHAAYTANLLLLALVAASEITGRALFPAAADVIRSWQALVGLWRSQLEPEEWDSLSDALALERFWDGADRDIRLRWSDRPDVPPAVDLRWTHGVSSAEAVPVWPSQRLRRLRRSMHLACDADQDVLAHALEPWSDRLPSALGAFTVTEPEVVRSPAHALTDVWLMPVRPASDAERERVYLRTARVARDRTEVSDEDSAAYLRLLLDRLAGDPDVAAGLREEVLSRCERAEADWNLFQAVFRSIPVTFGANETINDRLAVLVDRLLDNRPVPRTEVLTVPIAEVLVLLHELGIRRIPLSQAELSAFRERYGATRPDLVERMGPLLYRSDVE